MATLPALSCSFCGKSQKEVRTLVAGPSVYICNECIELAVDCLDKPPGEGQAARVETVEEYVNGDWAIWSFNKSVDDAIATLATLRRCNPDKRFRRATYVRLFTEES